MFVQMEANVCVCSCVRSLPTHAFGYGDLRHLQLRRHLGRDQLVPGGVTGEVEVVVDEGVFEVSVRRRLGLKLHSLSSLLSLHTLKPPGGTSDVKRPRCNTQNF